MGREEQSKVESALHEDDQQDDAAPEADDKFESLPAKGISSKLI